jgi:hypothetical protein
LSGTQVNVRVEANGSSLSNTTLAPKELSTVESGMKENAAGQEVESTPTIENNDADNNDK